MSQVSRTCPKCGVDVGFGMFAHALECPGVTVKCDVCDARETLVGEITEKTLEDDGWYLGDVSILCPEHSEESESA